MMNHHAVLTNAVLATVVIVGGLGIWLHLRTLQTRSEHLEAAGNRLAVVEQDAAMRNLPQQVATLRAAYQATSQDRPPDIADVLQALEADLADLGAGGRLLTTGTPKHYEAARGVRLNVAFKSSFDQLFELLRRVDNYNALLQVQRLVISREP